MALGFVGALDEAAAAAAKADGFYLVLVGEQVSEK